MTRSSIPRYLLLALACLPMLALATPGILSRAASMRADPRDGAAALQQLDKGAAVNVLSRDGGWYRVEYDGKRGWMRLYWVRTGGATVARAVGQPLHGISDTLAAVRARSMQSQIHATIGLRGMSEEDLRAAHYDAAQIAKLDGFAVKAADASAFAASGPVRSRNVAELQTGGSSRVRP